MLELTRGNRARFKYRLKIDGEDVTNLADATRLVFAFKEDRDDADDDAFIFVTYIKGDVPPSENIEIDTPDTGWVTVTLSSTNTTIQPGEYFFALQVEWAADDKLEFKYGDGKIKVEPDVIR